MDEMQPVEGMETITVNEAVEKYKSYGVKATTLRWWRGNRKLSRYKRGNGDVVFDARELDAFIKRWANIYPDPAQQ